MTAGLTVGVSVVHAAVALVAAALIAGTGVWAALRRTDRRRLAARVVATVMAVGCLAAIGLGPARSRAVPPDTVLLVTPGAADRDVRQAIDSLRPTRTLVAGDSVIDDVAGPLFVVGRGLAPYEWAPMRNTAVGFAPAAPPAGITDVTWKRDLTLGEVLDVQGRISANGLDAAVIELSGPGEIEDSVTPREDGSFVLRTRLRETGQITYRLRVRTADTVLFEEPIGVSVRPGAAVRVLVLESSPRFMTRHLKRWLAEQGGSVAIRARVSDDRFRYEFVNRREVGIRRLSDAVLREFDVAIVDLTTLDAMSAREQDVVRHAVERDGLGLLLIPDGEPPERSDLYEFRLLAFPDLTERSVVPAWTGMALDSLGAVPALPFSVQSGLGVRPLVWDGGDAMLAGRVRRGAGVVATSLVSEPHRWVLSGRPAAHGDYWAQLLTSLTEGRREPRWAATSPGPVTIGLPLVLEVITDDARPHGTVVRPSGAEDRLPLARDTIVAERWRGIYRPHEVGWHAVTTLDGTRSWFLVTDQQAWTAWRAARSIDATTRRAALPPHDDSSRDRPSRSIPISPLWFWLGFVGCVGFLWSEDKLLS